MGVAENIWHLSDAMSYASFLLLQFPSALVSLTPHIFWASTTRDLMAINKVLCIGANKTATTSMSYVLQDLGFRVPNTQDQERATVDAIRLGDFAAVQTYVERYDAFKDKPFSLECYFAAFDVMFPASKFILTVRDPDEWFRSLLRFHQRVFNFRYRWQANEAFFRDRDLYLRPNYMWEDAQRVVLALSNNGTEISYDWRNLYRKKFRVTEYQSRNQLIARYFLKRPDDLLIINPTRERDTRKVVDFLGLPTSQIRDMPHVNKT